MSGGWEAFTTAEGREYYVNKATGKKSWSKPDELKTDHDRNVGGHWMWVPHPVEGYVPGKVVEQGGKSITVQKEDGERQTFKDPSKLIPLEYSMLKKEWDDLVQMETIDEGMIAHNLRFRLKKDKIYTNIGTILIAMNPFKALPVYTEDIMTQYRNKGMRQLAPHIYDIADASYRALCDVAGSKAQANQAILISGESGAGKTVSTKHVLAYLAQVAGTTDATIKDRILAANPLLESFGNAKTIVNDNSSRFGKWVEIFFDESRKICGAKINNYLLEKARVTYQARNERNFHIFYQMCVGCDAKQKAKYKLARAEENGYMFGGLCCKVNHMDDKQEFKDMENAMDIVGFSAEEKALTLQLVAGIIHAGNFEYGTNDEGGAVVSNRDELEIAAELFAVSAADLEKAITKKTLIVRGQDPVVMPLDPTKAGHNAAAMSKMLYKNMFDWLVVRVNAFIAPDSDYGRDLMFIGVLDIFGFEIFERNSFEQLCINFTNEKLQQHFNRHTFKLEEQLYKAEQIKFTHVIFIDNQICLDLIEEKPNGVLFVLDEELVVPDGSDKGFINKLHQKHHKKHERYDKDIKNPDVFVINHYAGAVKYDVNGFLEKNKDTLEYDLLRLMQGTKLSLLKDMFPDTDNKARKRSLGFQFKNQLNSLMEILNSTAPHYVRCIRSNNDKKANQCDGLSCLLQLRYSGVFEAVRIRQTGYPFRYRHNEFVLRYGCLDSSIKESDPKEYCRKLFQSPQINENFEPDAIQLGLTRVLYRAEQHRTLELLRSVEVWKRAIICQSAFRMFRAKKLLATMIEVDKLLKEAIRRRDLDYLEEVLAKCTDIWFPMRSLKPAREMRDRLKEERRVTKELEKLQNADPDKNYDAIMNVIYAAEKIEMSSPLLTRIQERVRAIREKRETKAYLAEGCSTFNKEMLQKAITTAVRIGLYESEVSKAREILALIEKEEQVIADLEEALAQEDGDPEALQAACEEAQGFSFRTPAGRELLAKAEVVLRLRTLLNGDFKVIETWDEMAEALGEAQAMKLDIPDVKAAKQRIRLRAKLESLSTALAEATEECDREALEKGLAEADGLGMENSPWFAVIGKAKNIIDVIVGLETAMAKADGDTAKLSAAIAKAEKLNFRETKGAPILHRAEATLELRKCFKATFMRIEEWDAVEKALFRAEELGMTSPEVQDAQDKRQLRKEMESCSYRIEDCIRACDREALELALEDAKRLNLVQSPWGEPADRGAKVLRAIKDLEGAMARQDGDIASLTAAIARGEELGFRTSGGSVLLERAEATLMLRQALKAEFMVIADYDNIDKALSKAEKLKMSSPETKDAQKRRKLRKDSEKLVTKLKKDIAEADRDKLEEHIKKADGLGMSRSPWSATYDQSQLVLKAVKDLEAAIDRTDMDTVHLAKAIKKAEELGFRSTGGVELLEIGESTLWLRKCLKADFLVMEEWDELEEALDDAEDMGLETDEVDMARRQVDLRAELEVAAEKLVHVTQTCEKRSLEDALQRAISLGMERSPWGDALDEATLVLNCIKALEGAMRQTGETTALRAAIVQASDLGFGATGGADLLRQAKGMLLLRASLKGNWQRIEAWDAVEQALHQAESLDLDEHVVPEMATARKRVAVRRDMEDVAASLSKACKSCGRQALDEAVGDANSLGMSKSPWSASLKHASNVLTVVCALEAAMSNQDMDTLELESAIARGEKLNFRATGGRDLLLQAEATLSLRIALAEDFTRLEAYESVETALENAAGLELKNAEVKAAKRKVKQRRKLEALVEIMEEAMEDCDRDGLEQALDDAQALGMRDSPWTDLCDEVHEFLQELVHMLSMLEEGMDMVDEELLTKGILAGKEMRFDGDEMDEATLLRDRIRFLRKATLEALVFHDVPALQKCMQRAERIRLEDYYIDNARQMLAAVSADAVPLVPSRFFDVYLPPSARPFALRDFDGFKPPMEFASAARGFMTSEKKLQRLAEGMLVWDSNPMPTSLITLDAVSTEEALSFNKRMLYFMGDAKKGDKRRPEDVRETIRDSLVKAPAPLRDEIYCQIIKQLTRNPTPESTKKGWLLMREALKSFPPSQHLETFVEHFLRHRAPETESLKRREWVSWLHISMFSPASLARWPRESSWMLHR